MTGDLTGDLAYAIVNEVAVFIGASPADVEPPIGTVVNIEAIATLIETSEAPIRVTFSYREFEVTVTADGGEVDVFVHQPGPR